MSLILAGVVLDGFEVSGGIKFGGTQRLDVHDLSGGGRVVDVLGHADGPIEFAGFLTGPDASVRARLLDALRASGAAVPMIWDAYYYTVVIQELTMHYAQPFWIGFAATCTVVRDEAQAIIDAIVSLAAPLFSGVISTLPSLPNPFASVANPVRAFSGVSATSQSWATSTPAAFA